MTTHTSDVADLPEALTEYLEAQDALDNREYAGINAEPYEKLVRSRNHARAALESALAAGQVTAAPAIGDELRDTLVAVSAAIAERDDRAAQKMIGEILAASPTPPAEQQATKETSGGFHVWRDISTAPKDGSRFVATGHNYGLYSEGRHACVAQWFRGSWIEASEWNEASELKHLTHWLPLPSPPDNATAPAEQAALKAAPGEQNTVPAEWLEQAYREGWAACRDAETIGEEAEDWAFGNSTANSRMIDAQQAAPQLAPATSDDVVKDAARYRFIHDVPYSDDVRSVLVHQQNAAMDRVIDAARAAQKGFNHDN